MQCVYSDLTDLNLVLEFGMSGRQTMRLVLAATTCFVAALGMGYSQEATSKPVDVHWENGPSKFENGLQILWRDTPSPGTPNAAEYDPEANVEIFDGAEGKSVVCHVASAIREIDSTLSGVSISDVSARNPGFIAVAAVYSRTIRPPVALLLFFSWSGSLSRSVVLNKLPQIESLEIDGAGHVWALNDLEDRTANSVFTEFESNGSVVRQLVKPQRHWSTDESVSQGGQLSFGLTSVLAWTWLPKSRTLVSVDKSNGRSLIQKTGLPHVKNGLGMYAGRTELLTDGRVLMEVHWHGDMGWFLWSTRTGWERITGHRGDYLYTANGDQVIFATSRTVGSPMAFRSDRISGLIATSTYR